ncbi:MAG: NIPSNAP family protein [Bacteroidales bacterium]
MKKILSLALFMTVVLLSSFAKGEAQAYYQIKFYWIDNDSQMNSLDQFFEQAYLPALHRAGIDRVGVFKPIEGKNEKDNFVMVFIPFGSLQDFEALSTVLENDKTFQEAGKAYLESAHDDPPYTRIESIILRAFSGFPQPGEPVQEGPKEDRVYELRSYQSATEQLYERKVEMFNNGECALFVKLGFHPVFFGDVLSSSYMPHLMYMITFKDETSQEAHWSTFVEDPEWINMRDMERYQNTVSNITRYLLHPAGYSDF